MGTSTDEDFDTSTLPKTAPGKPTCNKEGMDEDILVPYDEFWKEFLPQQSAPVPEKTVPEKAAPVEKNTAVDFMMKMLDENSLKV
eukprot:1194445-Prorocentrum_minimum.AAC.3